MNPYFRPLEGGGRISAGHALQNPHLWKGDLPQRRIQEGCGRISEPYRERLGGLEGAPGFSAPRKFENMFSKLGSIHIQFKTLQEFHIILSVRIRTKLAIVKQPSVTSILS